MSEKSARSPFARRVITLILFASISGVLMGMYYLVYLPQQHEQFNQRTFRVLREITSNFIDRLGTFETKFKFGLISQDEDNQKKAKIHISSVLAGNARLNKDFQNSFTGDAKKADLFQSIQRIENDSIFYTIKGDTSKNVKSIKEILDPLISTHANTFESVLLIKQKSDTIIRGEKLVKHFDSILYKSPSSYIVNINTDSLIESKRLVASAVTDVPIEGVSYKMFAVPFQIRTVSTGTFVLVGVMSQQSYRQQSQAIPVYSIFIAGFSLVILLLALPFLKVFVLSIPENITIRDVRMLIAAIFIIPFVITLFISAIWLYKYPENISTQVLENLQVEVKKNFYDEITACLKQAKDYDVLMNDIGRHPILTDTAKFNALKTITSVKTVDLKDLFFYPQYYKNMDNVHWMNSSGNDIASWTFLRQAPTYFKLSDRQYFKEVLGEKGFTIPGGADTFFIQPTISRLTGEFTINISTRSNLEWSKGKKGSVVAISSKMYSVYNTVVPAGFAYCIVNDAGEILCHSDTARSLQENLFQETSDNQQLQIAIGHKDEALIDNVDLYEKPVKMMVRPMSGLPYYLVTYYDKRSEYLFIVHILGFVFLCQSVTLLFVTIFSFCILIMHKKIYKLNFIPHVLYWLKPSYSKREYYIKNSFLLVSILLLVLLFTFIISKENHYLYMLNVALLLPLFAITGYYVIKGVKGTIDNNVLPKVERADQPTWLTAEQGWDFILRIKNVLLLYVLSLGIFSLLKYILFYNKLCETDGDVVNTVHMLMVIIPILMIVIASANFIRLTESLRRRKDEFFSIFNPEKVSDVDFFIEKDGKNSPQFGKKKIKIIRFIKAVTSNSTTESRNYLTPFIVSLLLSVAVICVIPTITFTGYALHQEKKLQFQTNQLELAKRIQKRRVELNGKYILTKIMQPLADSGKVVDSLKFNANKGLYLYNNVLDTVPYPVNASGNISCSPFYQMVTQFLFLPPDHDEFYDNPSHQDFYFWKEKKDKGKTVSATLYYKNLTDYKNTNSIRLNGPWPHFNLYQNATNSPKGCLILLSLVIFIIVFYKIIYSVATRIFLVGYFDHSTSQAGDEKSEDKPWVKMKYAYSRIEDVCEPIFWSNGPKTFFELRSREDEILEKDMDGGETIVRLHSLMTPVYEKIWKDCTDVEKFTLYDLALDGFTNYKKVATLSDLYNKGLLLKEDDNLTLLTKSFRNFLFTKGGTEEVKLLSKQGKGSWSIMKSVFYIILLAVAVFIFISQEEASKRLITVVTSFAALLPVILKLFDKSSATSAASRPAG